MTPIIWQRTNVSAVDMAFLRLSLAVLAQAKRDATHLRICQPHRDSAREFLYGDDSYRDLYLDMIRATLPGAEIGRMTPPSKGAKDHDNSETVF